ncbi:MAG: glutaredoxin family protein [Cyanobacteria bacterium J06638_7]
MTAPVVSLLLYSRRGCCLCEGLEEKLRALEPPPALRVVDVDDDPALQARYGLEVPVLLAGARGGDELSRLPPVPPRLQGAQLQHWLSRHGAEPPGA